MATVADRKDGCWSFVVVLVALLSQILVGGLCLTGGIFYVIFDEAFHSSATVTSWLCSIPNALWFFSSPISTILTHRYGYRSCMLIGGSLATVGLTASAFSPHIAFLFVSFGLLGGLGTGIHYTGCLAAVNDYFDKYKTLATGIISVGHNVGQAVFSVLVLFLFLEFGWRGGCLLIGGISFHYCFFAVVMRPFRPAAIEVTPQDKSENDVVPECSRNRKPVTIRWNVLRKSTFLCFGVSAFFINVSESMYLLYLPTYAEALLKGSENIAIVLAIFGISNGFGKVIYSFCTQIPRINSTILFTVSIAGVAICMALTSLPSSRHGLFVLVGACGFLYCVTGALVNAVMFSIVGQKRFVDGCGVFLPFKGLGNLVGGPLAGLIFEETHNFHLVFYLAAASMVIACLLMIHPIIYLRRKPASGHVTVEEAIALPTDDS